MASATPLTLVLLATVAIGVTAALLAWRERPDPGALPLVAMLAGQSWWSTFLIFQVQASTLEAKLLWVNLSWVGVVVIPVAWFLFALEYTGRDQYVRRPYVALLSVVPVVTVALAATGAHHDLLYVESRLVERGGSVVLSQTVGPWFWVVTGYTYLLGLLGSIPLLGLVTSDAVPFRGQGVALLVGTLAPWLSNVLFLAGVIPTDGVDPTPIAFSVSGAAYLGALTRFRLLGTSPSPARYARHLVFERIHEGAIVVDSHGYLVHVNERAADLLGADRREVLGRPASEAVPGYEALPEAGPAADYLTVATEDGRCQYDVTVTRLTDAHERFVGRVITFHDISEHLRQQQRLTVLNRVLRHNIRTETNLIQGYADLLGDGDETAIVKRRARRIEEIGEKSREVIDIFEESRGRTETVPLGVLLEGCVETVREAYPATTVEYESDTEEVRVDSVLESVVANVVENAAEHNTSADPYVRIRVERAGDRVRVVVADNGPGIGDAELRVLKRGTETPLEHGSGLGLWLVKWGVDIVGGTVEFSANRPSGSVVTVEAPVRRPPEEEGDVDTDSRRTV